MPLPKMGAAYASDDAGRMGCGRVGARRERRKHFYRCANTARCRTLGPQRDSNGAARQAALDAGFVDRLGKLYCPRCSSRGTTTA